MTISLIAAVSETNQLGNKGELLVHLPSDLKYFKKMTEGKIVVMGRSTFDSIGKALPSRTNIVLTRNEKFHTDEDVYTYHSVKDVLYDYKEYGEGEADLICIGGGQLYSQFLPYSDTLYLTRIHHTFENADAFFPEFDLNEWELINEEVNYADEKHKYDFTFLTYKRKGGLK